MRANEPMAMPQHPTTGDGSLPDSPSAGHPFSALIVAAGLVLATLAAYSGAMRNGFVDIDDDTYVVRNPYVTSGLSSQNIAWAFAAVQPTWHPLTWISLQADSRLFAMRPWGFHLTNVLLHAANTLILFLLLRSATGKLAESAIVAGLFALHPLHVESVAWVTERKDVLSTFFGFLALAAYARYAARPSVARSLLVTVLLALSLMAKPMFVTFPFVALLWDFWPLGRWRPNSSRPHRSPLLRGEGTSLLRLVAEKAPFFVLAAGLSIATFYAQRSTGAVVAVSGLTVVQRFENAAIAYVQYLRQSFWPADLIVFYPLPEHLPPWQPWAAAGVLAAVSVLVLWLGGRARYLVTGWFWFLGTLVPVIGMVQVGMQATADRYMYVPMVGLSIAVVWGLFDLVARAAPRGRAVLTAAFLVVLAICGILTARQVGYWKDRDELWRHALAVMPDNYRASFHLAQAALERGDVGAARELALKSLSLRTNGAAHLVLATISLEEHQLDDAVEHYHQALELDSGAPAEVYNGLGVIDAMRGDLASAELNFRRALSYASNSPTSHNNLGLALLKQGKIEEAVPWFEGAIKLDRGFVEAYENLATAFVFDDRWKDAATACASAVDLAPAQPRLRRLVACVLWELNDRREATRQYGHSDRLEKNWRQHARDEARSLLQSDPIGRYAQEKALMLSRQLCEAADPAPPAQDLELLARVYAASGDVDRARDIARRALATAEASGDEDVAASLRGQLDRFNTE
jgi:Flp pilus assembly protein TadD